MKKNKTEVGPLPGTWLNREELEFEKAFNKDRTVHIGSNHTFGVMNESINEKLETMNEFSQHPAQVKTVGFQEAVSALQEFKRVGFKHWDKDTFIFMQVPATIPYEITQKMQSLPDSVKAELKKRYDVLPENAKETFDIRYRSQIAMMLPDGTIKGYSFSPSKVLSKNWIILD